MPVLFSGAARREPLDKVRQEIQRRWGAQAILPASAATRLADGIQTGFPALDRLLGTNGVPLQAITVLSGATTCGKLTLAYKTLSQAQHTLIGNLQPVAILDLNGSTDADYLVRCGVELDYVLLVRPSSRSEAIGVLVDLVKSRELRAILVDSLADLVIDTPAARAFEQVLPQVNLALRGGNGALIFVNEIYPPWLTGSRGPTERTGASAGASASYGGGAPYGGVMYYAALHVDLAREGWIESGDKLTGYRAQARVIKSRGPGRGQSAIITIEFGETVRARETW